MLNGDSLYIIPEIIMAPFKKSTVEPLPEMEADESPQGKAKEGSLGYVLSINIISLFGFMVFFVVFGIFFVVTSTEDIIAFVAVLLSIAFLFLTLITAKLEIRAELESTDEKGKKTYATRSRVITFGRHKISLN
jgi:hypothetical protein